MNAARALVERPKVGALLEQAFISQGPRAVETLVRVIEMDRKRQRQLFDLIGRENLTVTKTTIIMSSPILRKRYAKYLESQTIDPGTSVAAVQMEPPAIEPAPAKSEAFVHLP